MTAHAGQARRGPTDVPVGEEGRGLTGPAVLIAVRKKNKPSDLLRSLKNREFVSSSSTLDAECHRTGYTGAVTHLFGPLSFGGS